MCAEPDNAGLFMFHVIPQIHKIKNNKVFYLTNVITDLGSLGITHKLRNGSSLNAYVIQELHQ